MAILSLMPAFNRLPLALAAAASRRQLILGLLGLAFFCSEAAVSAASVSKEHQLKAAFLFNFTKFIVWPPHHPGAAMVIGVLGRNPFGDELERVVRGRMIGGREIHVRFLNSAAEAGSVSLLFVPAGEERRMADAVASLHESAVLTVGESSQFAALGGIITFSMEADKIRFEINREAGLRAGLKISPQLLKLASSARRGTR